MPDKTKSALDAARDPFDSPIAESAASTEPPPPFGDTTSGEPRSELEQPIWAVLTSRDDVKMSNLTYAEAAKFAEQGVRERHQGVTITTAEAAARSKMPTW